MLYDIKLKRRHPRKAMRLGRHMIGRVFGEFDLNKEEVKLLETKECLHWFEAKKVAKSAAAPKKAPVKAKVEKPVVEAKKD